MLERLDDRAYLEPPKPPKPSMICDECERGLYDGDEYYEVSGKIFCTKCMFDCKNFVDRSGEYDEYEDFEGHSAEKN